MKLRVIDYIENEMEEVQTGTCELCFGTSLENMDEMILADENDNHYTFKMSDWNYGEVENYYIQNLVGFSEWLNKQDITEDKKRLNYEVVSLIEEYMDIEEKHEDEEY